MARAALSSVVGRCSILALGVLGVGCLPQNSDTADAGTNGSGTPASGLCVSQPTPCGGDVTGTWGVQSICAVSSPADQVNARFTSYPDCGGVCLAASMTASGTKKYDAGSLTGSESFQLTETLSLTSACFSEVTGTSLADDTCQAAASEFESAVCKLTIAGCTCQIQQTLVTNSANYLVSGNTLTETGPGNLQGSTMGYCVMGSTMTQRRTLPPGLDFFVTYTRR